MNELTLNVKQNPGVIELNFDEIEKALDAKLAEYKGAVFTEESKSIAKSEVANLRKLKKDFEDARKGVKKEWMKPYEDFEAKMKNLTEKIDEPICLIDSQLKDFERKRREERREKIKEIYQEIIGDMEEYCDLGRIYDTKWENATTTMRSIRESIATAVESARIAVSTISGMQSDAVEKALEIYKDSQDMETEFSRGFELLLYFVDLYLQISGHGDYEKIDVELVFNRDMAINEAEQIQNCSNSQGIISDETLIAHHPFVSDVEEELEALKRQKEAYSPLWDKAPIIKDGENGEE